MAGKFLKISKLEGIVLLLTLLFVGGTLLWFAFSQPGEGVTVVTERQDPEPQVLTETPETPEAPGLLEGEVLNLNTASQTELTRLPGGGHCRLAAGTRVLSDSGRSHGCGRHWGKDPGKSAALCDRRGTGGRGRRKLIGKNPSGR